MLQTQPLSKPHRTKEEYVYETLRSAIVRCEMAPGQKLVMDTLSEELGVSSIPIRTALQRLQAEGLVEITPHTGALVSEISLDTVTEIFVLLEALESVAFNVASQKITAEDIAELRQLLNEMTEVFETGNASYWYDLNNQFHLGIADITEMKMLRRFTSRALDSRDRLRYFLAEPFVIPRMAEAHAEHCQMIDLLESTDTDRLLPLVSQHNLKAKEAYQNLIENFNKS